MPSNGAQNTIFMPEGARATKMTIYSITGTNASNRESYWKEVAGVTYTPATTTVLDLDAPRSNPNKVTFELNDVPSQVTFTNTGEQQCVIIYLEYYIGGEPDGIGSVGPASAKAVRTEIFTPSGERITQPRAGMLYIVRTVDAAGRMTSRKVVF